MLGEFVFGERDLCSCGVWTALMNPCEFLGITRFSEKNIKIIQFVEHKFSVYINWAIWQKVSLTDGIWLKFEFRAL